MTGQWRKKKWYKLQVGDSITICKHVILVRADGYDATTEGGLLLTVR